MRSEPQKSLQRAQGTLLGDQGCSPPRSPSGTQGFTYVAASSPTPPTSSLMHNHPLPRWVQRLHPQRGSPLMWGEGALPLCLSTPSRMSRRVHPWWAADQRLWTRCTLSGPQFPHMAACVGSGLGGTICVAGPSWPGCPAHSSV